ncbi:MAG TPA: metal ABC transporter permease [Sutterella sp.]|nr:metal ABC transporter permease [Sutterella sp.]
MTMTEIFQFEFMQRAALASFAMAILCPVIGIFLVLRRTSMIGDTLAHASLAGVAISLVLGSNPLVGAFVVTAGCGVLIEGLRNFFRERTDLILTIVLALAVGTAVTLITSGSVQGRAENFLFGSVLTVTDTDIFLISSITLVALLYLFAFLSTLITLSFDEESAKVAGIHVMFHRYAFAFLTAAAVAAAIPVVGVLVLSSMIAIPVATALQLKVGFHATLWSAVGISIFDATFGLCLSGYVNAAPGGLTALTSVAVLALVMFGKRFFPLEN